MSAVFSLLAALLCSNGCVAEEPLIIPAYDYIVFENGYNRWNQRRHSSSGTFLTSNFTFEDLHKQDGDAVFLHSQQKFGRFDRTSNHLPISYNISVKGYLLYEAVENNTQFWTFSKVDLYLSKKPTLFFAVQKTFR
jgi:hypothetical protein